MHTLHGFSLLGLLVTATPAVSAPPSFGAWFDARVKAEKPEVRERFKADLDGDGQEDDVVCYVFETPEEGGTSLPVTLVGLATGERFALRGEGLGPATLECPKAPSSKGTSLSLGGRGLTGYTAGASLRFDKKGPLLTSAEFNDRSYARRMDLLSQRMEFTSYETSNTGAKDPGAKEDPVPSRSAAMLASGTQVPAPPAPVWVSWGQKNWSGAADADLKAQWLRKGNTVTVFATLLDDQPVQATGASAKAILDADHLELWWLEWKQGRARSVQLGVARTSEGRPVAAWIQSPGRKGTPLPVMRWAAPDRLEVDLPMNWIVPAAPDQPGSDTGDLEPPSGQADLTVVFSDSDGKGQETLVSTTEKRPGEGGFSALFIAAPGSAYPRLSKGAFNWVPVKQRSTLRELVP
ncbi:hypothetical protein D7W81_29205 [Corallococcus aberystwythensis]|uniref:VCBS repeat-containing protein n=2 Tax=Corallococcus aberystwythensis TaxID=2316722 RepID=A0A3A8PXA3_9BACT|nr:hypothetical protein D7W81_29205 [Corallococcus aberystwythensis]